MVCGKPIYVHIYIYPSKGSNFQPYLNKSGCLGNFSASLVGVVRLLGSYSSKLHKNRMRPAKWKIKYSPLPLWTGVSRYVCTMHFLFLVTYIYTLRCATSCAKVTRHKSQAACLINLATSHGPCPCHLHVYIMLHKAFADGS